MRTLILIIALLSLSTAFAGNNKEEKLKSFSINGKVEAFNESLAGVKIILDGKESVVYTDFDGNFIIENVLAGEHTLSISLITYNSKVITFNSTSTQNLEIQLQEK